MKKKVLQKLALRRRLGMLMLSSDNDTAIAASEALLDFENFHDLAVVTYAEQTNAAYSMDESGTPILDKLLEFVKWMYESGFLEFLIKLFAGMSVVGASEVPDSEVSEILAYITQAG